MAVKNPQGAVAMPEGLNQNNCVKPGMKDCSRYTTAKSARIAVEYKLKRLSLLEKKRKERGYKKSALVLFSFRESLSAFETLESRHERMAVRRAVGSAASFSFLGSDAVAPAEANETFLEFIHFKHHLFSKR